MRERIFFVKFWNPEKNEQLLACWSKQWSQVLSHQSSLRWSGPLPIQAKDVWHTIHFWRQTIEASFLCQTGDSPKRIQCWIFSSKNHLAMTHDSSDALKHGTGSVPSSLDAIELKSNNEETAWKNTWWIDDQMCRSGHKSAQLLTQQKFAQQQRRARLSHDASFEKTKWLLHKSIAHSSLQKL